MGYSIYIEKLTKKIKEKTILNNINLHIKQNTFTAIVGVSGAGKTTLLNAITNYNRKYSGNVYYDNFNIKENDLRNEIAYVPQEEILHNELTLYKEIYYKAKIKIKDKKEITTKINEVLKDLELIEEKNTQIKNLSGGQKKRLQIALELLDNPKVLILDEPTSGLDLNVEKHLMEVFKRIKEKGTTVLVTLHTVSNLHLCDEIIFMGSHGSICYQGKYEEATKYFKVNEFVDIYELLQKETDKYNNIYNNNFISKEIDKKNKQYTNNKNVIKNTIILSKRYAEIILKNKIFFSMLLLQGFIIAFLSNIALDKDAINNYDTAKIILFTATCAAMWTGIFNSVQEIVKEKQIIKKEYTSGINITSYVLSKIIVITIICFIQAIIYLTTLYAHFNFIKEGLITDYSYVDNLITFFLVSFSSAMLGLFVSACARKTEITLIFATIYMMMQLILSGVLLKLDGIIEKITHFVIGRYSQEAFGSISNLVEVVKHTRLNGKEDPIIAEKIFLDEAKEFYTYTSSHVQDIWILLIASALVLIALTIIILKHSIKKYN